MGNDIQIYGSKLYAVINVSNYIEVMEAKTAKHIGKIEIPNVRYIKFHNGKAYASSYVAPVKFDQNARVGYVAEIDTATLEVLRTVNVATSEELVIANNKIYVANSGGYMFPNYDRTVSVIDLETFKEEKKIDVGINLHRLRKTPYHELIVSSRGGDYYNEPSKLFVIDLDREEVTQTIEMAVSNLDIVGDSAYIYAVEWSHNTQKNTITYGILNIKPRK